MSYLAQQTHAWNIYQASKLSLMEFHVCISLIEHLSYASPHVGFCSARTLSYIHRCYEYWMKVESNLIENF